MDARSSTLLCLDSSMIKQKVVMCDGTDFLYAATQPDAFGFFFKSKGNVTYVMPLPIEALRTNVINLVNTYKNSTKNAKNKIFQSEEINNRGAPLVASFSSRGRVKSVPDTTAPMWKFLRLIHQWLTNKKKLIISGWLSSISYRDANGLLNCFCQVFSP